jgi:hypothetical protein
MHSIGLGEGWIEGGRKMLETFLYASEALELTRGAAIIKALAVSESSCHELHIGIFMMGFAASRTIVQRTDHYGA